MNKPVTAIALHYFRIPRYHWELLLTRIHQLGITSLYTPVPWGFHEFAAGKIDLTGLTNSRRDLTGFVSLALSLGFSVTLNGSPLLPRQDNLLNHGAPGWLLHQNPEAQMKNSEGTGLAILNPEHPVVLKSAERWYAALGQAFSSFPAPDNRLRWQVNFLDLPADYSEQTTKVQWIIWLRKRYATGGINALNSAYAPAGPFKSVTEVSFTAAYTVPAFVTDVQEFNTYRLIHANQTYAAMLKTAGLVITDDPVSALPHAVQINPDPADVGRSFCWAMNAPISPDGLPRSQFWAMKAANFPTVVPSESTGAAIIFIPPQTKPANLNLTPPAVYCRLLATGRLLPIITVKSKRIPFITTDEAGQTDAYLVLPTADTAITGYAAGYLLVWQTAQWQTITRCKTMLNYLVSMLQPVAPSVSGVPQPPALAEAQTALADANAALHKAALSIGALEEVFSTALNKPQSIESTTVLPGIDPVQVASLRQWCQDSFTILEQIPANPLTEPFSPAAYIQVYDVLVTAGENVIKLLTEALMWLRDRLATGEIPSTAWTIHAHLEQILRSLTNGVIRQ